MFYRFDAFVLDVVRREVWRDRLRIDLRPRPLEVLTYLVQCENRWVSAQELRQTVWHDAVVSGDAVRTAIRDVRRELDTCQDSVIDSRRRAGYRIVPPVERIENSSGAGPSLHTLRSTSPTIAVLPLHMFPDASPEAYLGWAMADALTSQLALEQCLPVVSQQSVRAAALHLRTAADIAEKVGADYLIEGSVHVEHTNKVRATLRLVHPCDGLILAAESYACEVADWRPHHSAAAARLTDRLSSHHVLQAASAA